jgi:hypothetical protein
LGVVSLAAANTFESGNQQQLKQLAAVVLKNITDAVLGSERLIFADVWKKPFKLFLIGMRFHRLTSFSKSGNETPTAAESLSILSMETFRSARSTEPTYVR